MSRVAKAPVTIPAGVEVTLNGQEIAVKGKNGTLKRILNAAVIVTKEENVYDRVIGDYAKGMDALLESERIKQEIVNFEHDLWEF